MNYMFKSTGEDTTNFKINIANWDVSNVKRMVYMFQYIGYDSKTFELGNIERWNTSKVTLMGYMFYYTARKVNYKLDLSSWNVNSVENHIRFNDGTTGQVIPPKFKS